MKKTIPLLALFLLASVDLRGDVIEIPGDYPTIQQGIDAAVAGDTVLILPGTYVEELEINQKDLTLGSHFLFTNDTNYVNTTILNGDSTYHILTCNGPHQIQVKGLTFLHGWGIYTGDNNQWFGGAVSAFDSTEIDIYKCKFIANNGYHIPGISAYNACTVQLRYCLFRENSGTSTRLLVNQGARSTTIIGCVFVSNYARRSAFISNTYGSFRIDSTTFYNNIGNPHTYGGAMCINTSTTPFVEITNCLFRHNELKRQRSLLAVSQAETLIISDCSFDSTTIEEAYDRWLVDLNGANHNLFLHNIRVSENYSIEGEDFGIGVNAEALETLTADSIFVVNNYEEFTYENVGDPGCIFLVDYGGSGWLSDIYVMNNEARRTDIFEEPDHYSSAAYRLRLGGNIHLDQAEISNNLSDYAQVGRGLYLYLNTAYTQEIILRNILIHDNSWDYLYPDATWTARGGGIFAWCIDKLELENVRIYNQEISLLGAAMYAWGCDTLVIRNSHFSDCGNQPIDFSADYFLMENTVIHNCWNDWGELWGHLVAGAIGSHAGIANCAIVDSYGDYGKAIYIGAHNNPNLKTVLIENCIINNTCPYSEELGYSLDANIDFTVRYSNIDGGWEGEGNIDVDPLFTDPENDDYTFLPNSPCIDAGNPDPMYNDPEDPNDPGFPLWPSQGTLHNDMGCYGGPGATDLWEYQEDVPYGPQPPVQPSTIELRQNYPNPFNPATTIEFLLPYPQEVHLTVYNLLGQQVATLADGPHIAGIHQVSFDGSGHASGVYIYQLVASDQVETKKMVLVK